MADTATMSFAALLKAHRIEAGLTQEMLAERAQLSVRTISDLERGVKQRPYPHTIRRLSHALAMGEDDARRLEAAARVRGEQGGRVLDGLSVPPHTTAFIGRRQDIDQVKSLLGRESVRLLTLTGPGGVRKTRLIRAVV